METTAIFKLKDEKVHSIRYECTNPKSPTKIIYFSREWLGDNKPPETISVVFSF